MAFFKKIIVFTFLLIALIVFLLLAALISEVLGAELTSEKGIDFLIILLGENYIVKLIVVLVVSLAVPIFITPELIKGIFKREEKPLALSPEETQKNYDTIRQYLRQRYERRKDQKLAGDQLFNLRIKPTTEGTTPEKADTFITLQGKKTGEEIQQIFEKARRRLLVTGLPGAGKTSLLLNLALELLQTDPDHLAVLLNLATWRSDFPSFDDWLREILPAELGVTKRYAAEILQKGQLTLLLDGLDEVAEEHRASCLKAIGEYGRQGRDYVISTRKDEYKALEKDAPVWAQIEVLPLTDKQLLAQLDRADRRDFPEAPDLKAALQHDPLLLRVAETPFYLNCLQLLFRGGNTLSELKLIGTTVEERQAEITERFAEQALAQPSKHGSPQQVRHWLAFLASRMTQRNKVVFELVDLRHDWWRWTFNQHLTIALIRFFSWSIGWVLLLILFGIALVYFILPDREGILFYLIMGTLYSLFNLITKGKYYKTIQISRPYQRFWFVIVPVNYPHLDLFEHIHLRIKLYRAGVLPLRLVHFLNEMTARHLLETDGATWRFRHRILQEYFAGQWRE
ncbi:MAG: NACHT domain-containing protein [Saprospiraceae bacterium]|nr:NACHT domain-containing protein [Saprospiraceae bacterium]